MSCVSSQLPVISGPIPSLRLPDVMASVRRTHELQPWQKVLSAMMGAVLTSLTTTPLEVVKTRLQGRLTTAGGGSGSSFAVAAHLVRTEGVTALWSGLRPSLLMQIPATALYYTAYDELKERLVEEGGRAGGVHGHTSPLVTYAPLISGVVSRAGAVTLVAPLELLRTRAMHRRQAGEGGLLSTLRAELASGGVRALWRGWGSTLWRDVPFSGIYWLGYERVREIVAPSVAAAVGSPSGAVTAAASSFIAGLSAGTVAALITTPFDVVKTRRQVKLYEEVAASAAGRAGVCLPPASTPSLLRHIAMEEGLRGLFAGVGVRVARVGPSCAIMISTYEMGKALFLSHGGGA